MRKALIVLATCIATGAAAAAYAYQPVGCEDIDTSLLNVKPGESSTVMERMDLMKRKHELVQRLSECNRAPSDEPVDAIEQLILSNKRIAPGELKAWLNARGLKKHAEYICPFGPVALFGPIDIDTPYSTDPGSKWWGFDVSKPTEVRGTGVGSREGMILGFERLKKCKLKWVE